MKQIFFIRHAKSSWSDPLLRDFDRPLNKRGLRDAPFMSKMLRGKLLQLDGIVSSPANRAISTAIHFAETFDMKIEDIQQELSIYDAYPEEVLHAIRKQNNQWASILVFGHNPAFTEIANWYSVEYVDNVPTCGIVEVNFPVDDWAQINRENGKVVAFHYPKQYFS
ncbi:MAG: histidine phosphatase family protein [Bacteroidota bacterium]